MPPEVTGEVATVPEPPLEDSTARPFLRANLVSLIAAALAFGLATMILVALPQQHGVESLWTFLVMLSPFIAAAVAIGWLDLTWARRLRLQLILPSLCFLVIFAYFVPRLFYFGGMGADFDRLYFTMLMFVPFIILALALALRLGGARTSTVVKVATAMLLVQLSGIEDLAFLTVNDLSGTDLSPIPEVWTWADHIAVRLGHHPTKYEAFVFIAVHLALAVAVLATPDRIYRAVFRTLRGWRRDPERSR